MSSAWGQAFQGGFKQEITVSWGNHGIGAAIGFPGAQLGGSDNPSWPAIITWMAWLAMGCNSLARGVGWACAAWICRRPVGRVRRGRAVLPWRRSKRWNHVPYR